MAGRIKGGFGMILTDVKSNELSVIQRFRNAVVFFFSGGIIESSYDCE